MKFGIFTIFDRITGSYGELSLETNVESAKRHFSLLCSKNPYGLDFELYRVGDYDTDTGLIRSCSKPEFVCRYEVNNG